MFFFFCKFYSYDIIKSSIETNRLIVGDGREKRTDSLESKWNVLGETKPKQSIWFRIRIHSNLNYICNFIAKSFLISFLFRSVAFRISYRSLSYADSFSPNLLWLKNETKNFILYPNRFIGIFSNMNYWSSIILQLECHKLRLKKWKLQTQISMIFIIAIRLLDIRYLSFSLSSNIDAKRNAYLAEWSFPNRRQRQN